MLTQLILVLCAVRAARFQSTSDTESCEQVHQNYFLQELSEAVGRNMAETQCQLRQQVTHQQCRCNDTSLDELKTELQLVKESLQQLTQQLKQKVDNGTIELTELHQQVKHARPGTPTIAHVLNGNGGVAAIALLNDQLFATRWGVAQVSVYNTSSFQLQRQLSFVGLGTIIHGLATCATQNYLYISSYDTHCIHRVDLSISGANTLIKWTVPNNPCALSVNSARNILVTYNYEKKVQEYTPTGSFVREISDSSALFQAVELSSGLLAVSRHGPVNGIFMVSMATQVKQSYGNQHGSGPGQMDQPHCLVLDQDGYILVSDLMNHRLLVMNPSLTDARELPLPIDTALRFPVPIVLDQSRGRLYVGERESPSGLQRLLVFDNVTNIGGLFAI